MALASRALKVCCSPEDLLDGRMIHGLAVLNGLEDGTVVSNSLITMYVKCSMEDAERLFWRIPLRDLIGCNALLGGYAENEDHVKAMQIYSWMRNAGIKANYITMVYLTKSMSSIKELNICGKPLHAHLLCTGHATHEYVANGLVTMYANCGDITSSRMLFDAMANRTVVSWNAIIAANVQHGFGEEALKLWTEMRRSRIAIDNFSLPECFSAAADLAALEEGQQLHCLSIKTALDADIYVNNAAMDMYGKSGKLVEMLKLVPEPHERAPRSWNILISGYARYGHFEKAEQTFKEMLQFGKKPDLITFLTLLSACNHAGLADKGLEFYNSINSEYGLVPGIKHCVCIVDLLGRVGRLEEAERFIKEMPVPPNDLVWRSLLSSCRSHKNMRIGMRAAERLLELDPLDDSAYVLLSNLYATNGRWSAVDNLRSHMVSVNLKKKPACSWIKTKDEVSSFGIGDKSHAQSDEIYAKLNEIALKVKEAGYVADTSSALHDTDEEQKEHSLWNHSEKLALAYALIKVPKGSTIRIFKNLRVCADCHVVFKLVSEVIGREIILRDPYRFHHFRDGVCSCSDFW